MLLHELFSAAAARHGERLAIDVPPGPRRPQRRAVTYRELARLAEGVAAVVQPLVHAEAIVGVLLPREQPLVWAAQLAIARCGAAWVCLDAVFPDEHLAHVLADSQAVAVLTDAAGAERLARAGVAAARMCVLDEARLPVVDPAPPPPWLHERSLAYVIYTSGTTGKPKGVQIEHRGIVNLIRSDLERFRVGPGDRVAQGSSAAYDSSLEETFLALASGGTAVVLDDETVRLGPDLVPWLRQERITVLCPPPTLLRAMDCADPQRELPDLRLCYAGGEAMPQDLADTWGAALWLENGYGPTECSVTVTRCRLRPGEPVTIGAPVPGNHAFVLDERLEPVADGVEGELCVGGVGLARGYLGQPELTAAKFVPHARLGRIYRTGDLVRRGADGNLVYLGRIDSQVKLRGYRIELEAIEAALAHCPGVREAACRVQGPEADRILVAFVVADDPARPPDLGALPPLLGRALPPYMVPAAIALRAELPRTVGGKLDRKALPEIAPTGRAAPATASPRRGPADEPQRRLAAAFAQALPDGAAIGVDDDFFELGGNSLRAARLVSHLRRESATATITVRDVYAERTVARLAALLARRAAAPPAAVVDPAPGAAGAVPGHAFLVTLLQAISLLLALAMAGVAAWGVGFLLLPWWFATVGLLPALLLLPVVVAVLLIAYTAVSLWFAVLTKELLIGRYRAGRQPLWSWFHLRHWLVVRAVRAVPWRLLEGTVLHNAALRALGARIGRRVHIHRGVDLLAGGWDLLEIGDGAMLGQESHVGIVELERGELVFGAVRLRAGSVVDVRAGLGPDTELGERAFVAALAFVRPGTSVPPGECWEGVPAQMTGMAPAVPRISGERGDWRPSLHGLAVLALALTQVAAPTVPFALLAAAVCGWSGVDAATVLDWLTGAGPWSSPGWVWVTVVAAIAALPLSLLGSALLLRWARPVPVGTWSRWSSTWLLVWWRTGVVHAAGVWLSGTLFWPLWLRLAGMRIGPRCEISTILDVLPEHVEIGAESFFADGIYLGVPRLQGGTATIARTRLGARTFLGNHVVIHSGQQLPEDLLLGVCTTADMERMTAGTSWFGLPPMQLPRREVVQVDRRLTHEPSWLRWGNRVSWEALRFALPAIPVLLTLLWFELVGLGAGTSDTTWATLSAVVLATLGIAVAQALLVVSLKWGLLGRVRPGQHALWSCWASRWDFLYVVWNRNARALLAQLEGTLLLGWFLRLVGVKVGRRVVLGDGFAQIVDPDMLELQDGATVQAMFQAHSFEDRVLKIDRVRIGAGADVGRGVVVLYGADVGAGATVMPHSVVMKDEHLLPARSYAGAPTQELPVVPPPPATCAAAVPVAREPALDFARGLAVLGMVFLHLVPPERDGSALAAATATVSSLLHGKPAATFLLLAGLSLAGAASRRTDPAVLRSWCVRRMLCLAAMGLALWVFVWPTEVLLPMALMLPVVVGAARRGAAWCLGVAAVLLLAVPLVEPLLAPFVDGDCLEDGTHLANHGVGWATLRYFLYDGSYPLLPWLALPLLGAATMLAVPDRRRARRWCLLALPVAIALELLVGEADGAAGPFDDVAPWLQATWQPTSLPFLLLILSQAMVVVAGCRWFWLSGRRVPRWTSPIAAVGRWSLSHYVAHLVLVYLPLRHFWPQEDWSAAVGLMAWSGYVAVALLISVLPASRWQRGPLEASLARVAGPRTAHHVGRR